MSAPPHPFTIALFTAQRFADMRTEADRERLADQAANNGRSGRPRRWLHLRSAVVASRAVALLTVVSSGGDEASQGATLLPGGKDMPVVT